MEAFVGICNPRKEFADAENFAAYWELIAKRAHAASRQRRSEAGMNRDTRAQAQQEAQRAAYRDPERLTRYAIDYARRFQPSSAKLRQQLLRKCADEELCDRVFGQVCSLVCDEIRVRELAESMQRQGHNSQVIRSKLRQRMFSLADVDRCLAALAGESGTLLNDVAVTRRIAAMQRKGLSQQAMRSRLMGCPADAPLVEAALSRTLGDQGDHQALHQALARLSRKSLTEREKIQRLVSKGFRYAEIRALLSAHAEK